uniref:Uncharacterized protein n=1 Tax=viral metagenome TaxID=1070528 RepID=A0A6H1ZUI1_9ZZZZ
MSIDRDYKRQPFAGRHDPYLSLSEERQGYPQARARLAGYSNAELIREYLDAQRDSLGRMFGHNAKKNLNLVADELLLRGVTSIPNLFGDIEVRHWK